MEGVIVSSAGEQTVRSGRYVVPVIVQKRTRERAVLSRRCEWPLAQESFFEHITIIIITSAFVIMEIKCYKKTTRGQIRNIDCDWLTGWLSGWAEEYRITWIEEEEAEEEENCGDRKSLKTVIRVSAKWEDFSNLIGNVEFGNELWDELQRRGASFIVSFRVAL